LAYIFHWNRNWTMIIKITNTNIIIENRMLHDLKPLSSPIIVFIVVMLYIYLQLTNFQKSANHYRYFVILFRYWIYWFSNWYRSFSILEEKTFREV
jgi:hypothetical protein